MLLQRVNARFNIYSCTGLKKRLKISIALATYNGANYLKEQLDSYLAQDRLPDEVVVCDDASTDQTIEILEAFKSAAPFQTKIIRNVTNHGYTKNFEKALSLCSGDVVLFSDQDDVWFEGKISCIECVFNEHPECSVIIHDGELVDENLEFTGATKLGQIRSGGYADEGFVTGALSAIHKDMLPMVLPFPEGVVGGHDGWIHANARIIGRRKVIEEKLQQLRRHSNNTSAWVASSTKKINRIDVLISQSFTAAADSYEDRLLYNRSILGRIEEIESGVIPFPHQIEYQKIRRYLEDEKTALLGREHLVKRTFFGRKLGAVSLFANGSYAHFNGFKSFLRDFLR